MASKTDIACPADRFQYLSFDVLPWLACVGCGAGPAATATGAGPARHVAGQRRRPSRPVAADPFSFQILPAVLSHSFVWLGPLC